MTSKATPVPTPATQPYWDAARRGELVLQRCGDCERHIFYPRIACPQCGSRRIGWTTASGRATLHSYVVSHLPAPGFQDEIPYVIAIVELEEGPRMMSNLRGVAADPAALRVDMPLTVVFEERDGCVLPMFRPAGNVA